MPKQIDFKEYTRIRDIVHKRNIRLNEAGLSSIVHFPTVKEIRAGFVDANQALKAIMDYYSGGSTVKAARQTGMVPEMKYFPAMPPERKRSEAEKRERKRAADRAYRRRKAIREAAPSEVKARKYESYLKALETVSRTWSEVGFDLGIDLGRMSPAEAKAFTEYMDYRFSQGDFSAHYVVDTFIQDFSKLIKKGYKGSDIINDFNKFLEQQNNLSIRAGNMEGLTSSDFLNLWDKFVGD